MHRNEAVPTCTWIPAPLACAQHHGPCPSPAYSPGLLGGAACGPRTTDLPAPSGSPTHRLCPKVIKHMGITSSLGTPHAPAIQAAEAPPRGWAAPGAV